MTTQNEAFGWCYTRPNLNIQLAIGVPAAACRIADAFLVDDGRQSSDFLVVLDHPRRHYPAWSPTVRYFLAQRNLLALYAIGDPDSPVPLIRPNCTRIAAIISDLAKHLLEQLKVGLGVVINDVRTLYQIEDVHKESLALGWKQIPKIIYIVDDFVNELSVRLLF
jgi:hypothetical protein